MLAKFTYIYIVLDVISNLEIKVYRKMCLSFVQVLHHFVFET